MRTHFNPKNNPRVIIIQKLYGKFYNEDDDLDFPKHRFKKFIKDIVLGTIERNDKGRVVVGYTSQGDKKEFEIGIDSTSYCVSFIIIFNFHIRGIDVSNINHFKFQHQSFVRSASWAVAKEMGKFQLLF